MRSAKIKTSIENYPHLLEVQQSLSSKDTLSRLRNRRIQKKLSHQRKPKTSPVTPVNASSKINKKDFYGQVNVLNFDRKASGFVVQAVNDTTLDFIAKPASDGSIEIGGVYLGWSFDLKRGFVKPQPKGLPIEFAYGKTLLSEVTFVFNFGMFGG